MTTHAARTVTFSASCPQDGTHGTCDPPEPVTHRWVRDVDSHLRRRA